MKELKINPELRDFIPPLSGEEKKALEDSLLKYGYKGAPIYTWNNYIVDGHNRYELCRKHNIDYSIEELGLGDEATIIDVMEWMINTQLGRRNLPPQQRIAVVKKFEKRIQEQARKNQSSAGKEFGNGKNSSSPNGEKLNKKEPIHTDKELAKLAGVGIGTIARFNRVMSSDDEDLKKKLLADEVKINTAYEKIREKETPKENIKEINLLTAPKTYQEAAQLFGGIQQGHLPNRKNTEIIENFTDEQLLNALISTKTPVNVLDSIIPKQEFDIMASTLLENISSCDYRIFDLHEVYKKMENKDLEYAIEKFNGVIEEIVKLEEKIKMYVKETK